MTSPEFFTQLGDIVDSQKPLEGTEPLTSLPGWDSMATISFIAMVDEELGITLQAEDVYSAKTVADLKGLVAAHLQD